MDEETYESLEMLAEMIFVPGGVAYHINRNRMYFDRETYKAMMFASTCVELTKIAMPYMVTCMYQGYQILQTFSQLQQ